jgi:Ni,Fe-hydrogenase I small subunit
LTEPAGVFDGARGGGAGSRLDPYEFFCCGAHLLRSHAPAGHHPPQLPQVLQLTATSLGLAPAFVPQIAHAMETKPRTPVLWLHGLECTCCTEIFIRSAHPLAKDVVLSMISLDYDDT